MPNPGQVLDGTLLETRNLPRLQQKLGIITSSGGVPTSRLISTTAPLMGGGDLSADRTHFMPQASLLQDGYLSAADFATFSGAVAVDDTLTWINL